MSKQLNYLITAANSALGKAIVHNLAQDDSVNLFLVSRSEDTALRQITKQKFRYEIGIDLRNFHKHQQVIDGLGEFFDGPFALIHCAGDFWDHLPFLDVSTERANAMMESHFGTFYSVVQATLPLMISRGGGRILTFSCNAVNQNLPNMLPFNAAKAAVEASVKCIAHEYAEHNIVANAIALSSLQTYQVKDSKPFGDFDNYLKLNEVADTALELINSSNHLTNGNVINCYEYSKSYYYQGYFQRIRQKQ